MFIIHNTFFQFRYKISIFLYNISKNIWLIIPIIYLERNRNSNDVIDLIISIYFINWIHKYIFILCLIYARHFASC